MTQLGDIDAYLVEKAFSVLCIKTCCLVLQGRSRVPDMSIIGTDTLAVFQFQVIDARHDGSRNLLGLKSAREASHGNSDLGVNGKPQSCRTCLSEEPLRGPNVGGRIQASCVQASDTQLF
jgi:hypothetical protein